MRTRVIAIGVTVMGFFLLGFAQAEGFNSKLIDTMATVAGSSEARSRQQEVASAPVDEGKQQAPSQDADNQQLENAQGEKK